MSLDWAAESEKEDLRLKNLREAEQREIEAARAESPSDENYVDQSTRAEITNSIGWEPIIHRPQQDFVSISFFSICYHSLFKYINNTYLIVLGIPRAYIFAIFR